MYEGIHFARRKSAEGRLTLPGVLTVSLLFAGPVFAQDEEQGDENQAPSDIEEVVVTGTSIRGVAPTGSDLITVDRQDIVTQGATSSSEMLESVPQLGNFNMPHEDSTPNRYRTSGYAPNIHGLGIYATLTLFNGHRFASTGSEGVVPNPEIIPVIALERAEIIADGASSIYGSDAVAGVVNLIYRRDFDGLELSTSYGSGEGLGKRSAAVLFGETWDSGSVMFAYEYTSNDAPQNRDFDFIRADQTYRGGRDYRTTNCANPNIVADGVTYGTPGFSSEVNRCDGNPDGHIVPNGSRDAVLITATQELNDRVEVYGELNYSHYDSWMNRSPENAFSVLVPDTNPYFVAPPGSTATEVRVNRSVFGLFPHPLELMESSAFGLTAGARMDLGDGWQSNLSVHASGTDDYREAQELDMAAAQELAMNTTLDTAFNPFGQAADNNPAVLALIDNRTAAINDANQYLRELQITADGPLFGISGGDVMASIGASVREEQTVQLQTGGSPDDIVPVRDDNISRTVQAVFGEIHIPLVSESNARPGIRRLDLSLSGRYDHYEKLGGTFNPKVGFIWEPTYNLAFQGSYGTSYVAPNLGKTTASFGLPRSGVNVEGFGTLNIYNLGGGNPDLISEEATTYSFGVNYSPEWVDDLQLGATYFNVEYTNLLYQPGTQDLFFNPFFADRLILNPTPEQIQDAIEFAPPARAVPDHIDAIYATYTMNLGTREVSGIDLNANYQFDTSLGEFGVGFNALRYLSFEQQVFETQPVDSRLGTNEAIRWKGRVSLSWSRDSFGASLFTNYVGSYDNVRVTPNENVDAFTTFDAAFSYHLSGALEGFQVFLRAENLLDEDPPFYNSSNGYDTRAANPFGRLFEISLRANF